MVIIQVYAAAGTVKQNYVNILLMLLRLRQACDHPLLVKGYNSNSVWRSSVEMAKKLSREKQIYLLNCLEGSLAICGICNVCLLSLWTYFHLYCLFFFCSLTPHRYIPTSDKYWCGLNLALNLLACFSSSFFLSWLL